MAVDKARPVHFEVEYPERDLNRLTTALHNRVVGYAFILVTDEYPPFKLGP